MIECPSCGKAHRLGTLFCTECGTYLPTGQTLRTEPFPTDELSPPRAAVWQAESVESEDITPYPVRIHVLETGREIILPALPELLLGRMDPRHGIFPHADLSPDRALDLGVSRRHARILQQRGRAYLEDLGSANGTYLNGERLTPYVLYPLPRQAEVQLGRLRLQITLGD
ncbi:MAG: FHA domain-containing protein [Anaerolineae bacterium]|nr:FHA domain-containing protein [Anaerolineae bacterium]MCX8067179.1 FHA domain-containing protein [Anaerolineae bacterium]MDW7990590.1 FHA domain-containing protein [Anaerolineae bacterium]